MLTIRALTVPFGVWWWVSVGTDGVVGQRVE